jgi:antitoxin YefM
VPNPTHSSFVGNFLGVYDPKITYKRGSAYPFGVTIILIMSETLPLANVKSKFSEMVNRVEHTHDRIIVTRNGRPAAVLISPDELASLEDTLEMLSDPEAMAQLEESKRAYRSGDFVTGDELRDKYAKR